MQLNVFNTDQHKSGFRLQYMEIYNWGTFDEHVWKIEPGGETSLLTGANGSGKTTFVDALLTLIVPEKKHRFYNQSSGSDKKGDRTEETYVLGGYGTIHTDSGNAAKTLYLRESKEAAYSILLAHFANEAEQYVTLFQVRYFSGGDMKRVFAIAHKPLHIEEDFTPFDLNGNWRRRLDQQFNNGSRKQIEWFDAASRYAHRLVEVLGMQSIQALSLFNQTVGIKVLGELNEFIRTNMLEPRNMEDQFQELKKHLTTLLDAQRNIEKTEEQIRLLQNLQEHYIIYKEASELLNGSKQELETTRIWKNFTRFQLLSDAIKNNSRDLEQLEQQLADLKQNIAHLLEEERQTKNQIENNKAGQRLQQLEKELEMLNAQLTEAETLLSGFVEWCNILNLGETQPVDEAAYHRIKKEAERVDKRLVTEIRNNDEDRYEAQDRLKQANEQKAVIENELNVLLHSKNNIPGHLISLRKEICDALKIDTSELPFAGELIQVKPEEQEWQPALEKLLHSFSLRLLVPDSYYKKVNRYVNNTNLRTRFVYYRVGDVALDLYAEDDTVYHKLDFHPDHPLSAWVEQQIIHQFDYVCVADEKELERYNYAITLNSLIKSKDRHEKDDRSERADPSRYVMGWNNEKKKEVLQQKRSLLLSEIEQASESMQRAENKNKQLQKKVYTVKRIAEHTDFKSIHTGAIQLQMHKAGQQIEALKESSDQLKSLAQQLDVIEQQRIQNEKERDELVGKIFVEEKNLQEMQSQQKQLEPFALHLEENDKDLLLQFQQKHSTTLSEITLQNIETSYEYLKTHIDAVIARHEETVTKEEREVERAISKIKNPPVEILQRFTDWAADVHLLPNDCTYANEYLEWLQKLETENLPKYKTDFERYLHETMVYKIGELNEELDNWETKIKNSIQTLNRSLGEINFNRLPDTYIQLGIRPVADTTIKEFRHNLLVALPQAADWQQSSFEEKAIHFKTQVEPLINSLDEAEAFRSKVLDVRNWFEFWADEKYRNTDELKKTYRQMGQLSGGEKAQLTYTILCSAIAYQFGITKEGSNPRSLRFIAVDESFSNQDEEKATYLMELCRQLHLQLLVVTPSDKIQVVENFIAHVHLVQRVNNRHSVLYNMTKKELKEKQEEKEAV